MSKPVVPPAPETPAPCPNPAHRYTPGPPLTGRLTKGDALAYVREVMGDPAHSDTDGFSDLLSDTPEEILSRGSVVLSLCPVCRFAGRHGQPCDVCAAFPAQTRNLFESGHTDEDDWDVILNDAAGRLREARKKHLWSLHRLWLMSADSAERLAFAEMLAARDALRDRIERSKAPA